jgi:hypothetical protein
MKTESHVKKIQTRRSSTSKIIFNRQWEALLQDGLKELIEWLQAHYGVKQIGSHSDGKEQVRLFVTYKAASDSQGSAVKRAHAVDGFIGGWMAARRAILK